MRHQYASRELTSESLSSSLDTPQPSQAGPGSGNASMLDRMNFVNDMGAWFISQVDLIDGMEGTELRQRSMGVFQTLVEASRTFQMGGGVDVSAMPMAPTAEHMPSMAAITPELVSLVQPYLSSQVADASGSAYAPVISRRPTPRPEHIERQAATHGKSIVDLVGKIMGLKLKLPGEERTFSLTTYADEESVGRILRNCVSTNIESPDQVAYILATAWQESRLGEWMTESGWLSERSAERYAEKNYGPSGRDPERARRNGNTEEGDGGRYMGRGYVQLTWKNNYERMSTVLIDSGYSYTQDGVTYGDGNNGTTEIDLVTNYNHVNRNKELAARILVLGMDGGEYVNDGRGLDHYIPEDSTATRSNFENARRIVNGSDKKALIATNAITIQTLLRRDNTWTDAYNLTKGNLHGP